MHPSRPGIGVVAAFASAVALAIATAGGTALAGKDTEGTAPHGRGPAHRNGGLDWREIAADGQRFAFVLATDGKSLPGNRLLGPPGNGEAGLLTHSRHLARPDRSAEEQAAHLVKTTGYDHGGTIRPPVLELEVNQGDGSCFGKSVPEMAAWTQSFLDSVRRSTGQDAIVYTSPTFWQRCLASTNSFENNPLWVAPEKARPAR